MFSRRQFGSVCLALAAVATRATRAANQNDSRRLIEQLDRAGNAGARFLCREQASDGAWRSRTYGPLKDGPSLTAFIAATLCDSQRCDLDDDVMSKARGYLARLVQPDGSLAAPGDALTYPVYTAAGAMLALGGGDVGEYRAAKAAWLACLRRLQLTEENGWHAAQTAYGGWSYSPEPPRPVAGRPPTPLAAPNLSATAFALDALSSAGVSSADAAIASARVFVERCQNWPQPGTEPDPRFDDGGFFFLLDDTVRNKAGEAGVDRAGRVRYASYGSATADGLRSLLLCGADADDARVHAAGHWLATHFAADQHPGDYGPGREHLRSAVYYYYCASVAQALGARELMPIVAAARLSAWPQHLAHALLKRQKADGSWANATVEVREDDPLVATPLALRALTACRRALTSRED